jgi:GNAT superfamily N-acetyltransferase
MDIEHAIAFIDTIDWALIDTRFIFDVYTWLGNYVCHGWNSTQSPTLYYSYMGQISESDIGKRVTIRLHDNPGYRDIVGQLLSPTSIKNRHGEIVNFDPTLIYLWREIKEVPRSATKGAPLSIRVYDLERAASKTWQAREEAEVGSWLFRADIGITRRANSALVLGSDNHIDEVISWYRKRDLQPTISIVPDLLPELDQEFERRGFAKLLDVHVMVKDPSNSKSNLDFENLAHPNSEWLAVHSDEKIEHLLKASPAKYLMMRRDGKVAAIGRIAFADGWAMLSRIWVDPKLRGQGLGREMLKALESQSQGAKLGLQVSVENEVAIELYRSAGYVIHHTYRLRSQSQQINLSQDCQC